MRSWMRRVLDPLLPVERFSRSDRRITFIIWTAGVVQGFAQAQASATLPFTRDGLDLSEGEMSLLLGVARLAAFAALPLGWLGDRRGRRRPFLLAVTLVVAGGTISGLAMEAWQYGAAHALLRTGTAAMSGLAIVLLAEQVNPTIRAYAVSFYGAAVSFGAGMALMTLPLADNGGESWRVPHLLIALGFLVIPFLVKALPESAVFSAEPKHQPHWDRLISGPWARSFWLVIAIGFLASMWSTLALAFSTTRLIQGLGLTTATTVIISLAGGTAGGIGFFIGGHLADTWGRRRTSVIALLLTLVGGLTVYWLESIPIITLGVLISSFGTFAFVPAAGSHRAELFPTDLRATANTASANFSLAGSGAGLIAGIFVIDSLGLSASITVLAPTMLAGALLTLALPETRGQDLTAVEAARP